MWEKRGISMTCTEAYKEHIEYMMCDFVKIS